MCIYLFIMYSIVLGNHIDNYNRSQDFLDCFVDDNVPLANRFGSNSSDSENLEEDDN